MFESSLNRCSSLPPARPPHQAELLSSLASRTHPSEAHRILPTISKAPGPEQGIVHNAMIDGWGITIAVNVNATSPSPFEVQLIEPALSP